MLMARAFYNEGQLFTAGRIMFSSEYSPPYLLSNTIILKVCYDDDDVMAVPSKIVASRPHSPAAVSTKTLVNTTQGSHHVVPLPVVESAT